MNEFASTDAFAAHQAACRQNVGTEQTLKVLDAFFDSEYAVELRGCIKLGVETLMEESGASFLDLKWLDEADVIRLDTKGRAILWI